jgi:hypothetical protein
MIKTGTLLAISLSVVPIYCQQSQTADQNKTTQTPPVRRPARLTQSAAQQPAQLPAPPPPHPGETDFVRVSTTTELGPMGYVQVPAGLTSLGTTDEKIQQLNKDYKFPSIYIYISAAPVRYLKTSADNQHPEAIPGVADGDREISWMDATFTLNPKNSEGHSVTCVNDVQVIGLLPGPTVATVKTPLANTVATVANQLMTAFVPFFPPVKDQSTAASSAFSVLFSSLFPPTVRAIEYSYLDGCEFGWYYKSNTAPPTSVLGTQTGLILLRTTKLVTSIELSSYVLSSWTGPTAPGSSSRFHLYKPDKPVSIEIPAINNIDYGSLQDLSLFPMLISVATARNILHIDKDADWTSFIAATKNNVQLTPDNKYVIKATLEKYLGGSAQNPPAADPKKQGN